MISTLISTSYLHTYLAETYTRGIQKLQADSYVLNSYAFRMADSEEPSLAFGQSGRKF